ncbi:hypothetical protein [Moorena sp. SIO4A1]|nr:hypothetical protein [Moorena sp. SIO4A1]
MGTQDFFPLHNSPYSRLHYSLFAAPYSLFPIPCSLIPKIVTKI